LRERDDRFDRRRCQRGVDDDWKRRILPPDVLERLDLDRAARCRGIGDDDVGGEMLHRGMELGPRKHRCETVLRTENDFEVGEKRTGEEGDYIQAEAERRGSVMNSRNRDTKCEFTLRPATLGFRQQFPAKKTPAKNSSVP